MRGRVLIIAGSDSGGGAGIQADIKAVTALGAFAMTAITALTAQNTQGVFGVHEVPLPFLRQQIDLVLSDLGADAVKTGMLHSAAVIDCVADALDPIAARVPVVVDPVMVAKGGHPLLQPEAVATLKRRMCVLAALITPNIAEAEVLTGLSIRSTEEMAHAAEMLLTLGPKAVLLKGGHLEGDTVSDLLATPGGIEVFTGPRVATRHTHGTGCTLASAIAAGLAQGMGMADAVRRARAYVLAAIRNAPGYGAGHGPLDHAVTVDPARLELLAR
ncbi:MAG: bifunctional hydroxymethylpyrimidine kinase/phosphomethylpyrimidine kinase [Alphaproteobacteria bacterium]|nr:bifunctional hydroxymethylpyrimidine kinase/phosphomethylpyrimidine kinase [Alphaproteobacteria bacterium]